MNILDFNDEIEFIAYMGNIATSKDIYVYGAGRYGQAFGTAFKNHKINFRGYIDSNVELIGNTLSDKPIFNFDDIQMNSNTIVIISMRKTKFWHDIDEIDSKLKRMGLPSENILYFGYNYDLIDYLTTSTIDVDKIIQKNLKLKNIYKNKRGFIIGNGPSLCLEDINRLIPEVTLGCNSLYYIYKKTEWRPTCFFMHDSSFWDKHVQSDTQLDYFSENCEYLFTSLSGFAYENSKRSGKLETCDNLFCLHILQHKMDEVRFIPDLTQKIHTSATTLYTMLQTAVFMGIHEIYLIGVDFSFQRTIDSKGNLIVNPAVTDHPEIIRVEGIEGVYYPDHILHGYKVAKQYADAHGIKIYNATRGGGLEVFERVDFDSLFIEEK